MILSHSLPIPEYLYVHYPICRHQCSYCDFNVFGLKTLDSKAAFDQSWLQTLLRHLDQWGEFGQLRSLYFGGGTPSLIEPKVFISLVQELRDRFSFCSDIEISLEANPEDISEERLRLFADAGVNRLSIGVQSFLPAELKRLERLSTQPGLETALNLVSKYFRSFSFDLMFGIPEQKMDSLEKSLDRILQYQPPHISIYLLTISEDHKWRKSSTIRPLLAGEELCHQMYQLICKRLAESGYRHYEVSNFAKPGFESRHNQNYWNTRSSYLGLGPGAHGYLCGAQNLRYENHRDLIPWSESLDGIEKVEDLSPDQTNLEEIYLALRTRRPVSELHFDAAALKTFEDLKFIERSELGVVVSESAWILLDGIASKLLQCR